MNRDQWELQRAASRYIAQAEAQSHRVIDAAIWAFCLGVIVGYLLKILTT